MGRLTIASFAKPPIEYRPSKQNIGFESVQDAAAEDEHRARSLEATLDAYKKADRKTFKLLIRHLRLDKRHRDYHSCASSVDMREARDRFAGWVAAYMHKHGSDCRFVTLVPQAWKISAGELKNVSARQLMLQLRSDLNRVRASDLEGGIIAGLDCEYDRTEDAFQFHAHLIVSGTMIQAFERLRKKPKYRGDHGALRSGRGAVFPIKTCRIDEVGPTATYILKSFWVERASAVLSNGAVRRSRAKQRIKGLQHTDMLLWLHRTPLSHLVLTMKLDVTRHGFKPS